MGIIGISTATARVNALAVDRGISVIYETEGNPRTSKTKLWVEHPKPEWSKSELLQWEASLYHEISHHSERGQLMFDEDIKSFSEQEHQCINALEDVAIEDFDYGIYQGRDKIIEAGHLYLLSKAISTGVYADPNAHKFASLVALMCAYQQDIYSGLYGFSDTIFSQTGDKYKELLLDNFSLLDPRGCSPKEVIDKGLKLHKLLYEEESSQEQPSQGEEEGEADSEDITEGLLGGTTKVVESDEDCSDSCKIEYAFDGYDANVVPIRCKEVRDFVYDNRRSLPAHGKNSGLAKQAKRLLIAKSKTLQVHGQKQGKLKRNIHKVLNNNNKVFTKKVYHHKIDTAVHILLDCSGSMCGTKFEIAATACLDIGEALQSINVNWALTGFTHAGINKPPLLYMLKEHGQAPNYHVIKDRLEKVPLYNNSDGDSLMAAYQILARQPNNRKILIVLSDGMPASSRSDLSYDGDAQLLKLVAQEVEKKAEVYSIGIEDDSVEQFYTNTAVINHAADLERVLGNLIKTVI